MSDWTILAAYPARIRRKHGAELIDTMLEMAGPGGQPTSEAKRMLLLDGLRERFRPPVRRPFALVAAILALLVGGALGAAAGSWLGTLAYPALPDGTALGQRVLAGEVTGSNADSTLSAFTAVPDGADTAAALDSVRQKLTAEGWRAGPMQAGDGVSTGQHFIAETDTVSMDVYIDPDGAYLYLSGVPQRPAVYLPLTIAGWLLGLLAGWLLGVALSHRIQTSRQPMAGALPAATGLVLTVPSAIGFITSLARYLAVPEPLVTGEMLHLYGFAFGPTVYTMRALDIGAGWWLTPADLQQLWILGVGLIAIAAIVALPAKRTDHQALA